MPSSHAVRSSTPMRSVSGARTTHSDVLTLHHWYVHRCLHLGWRVHWIVTTPSFAPAEPDTTVVVADTGSPSTAYRDTDSEKRSDCARRRDSSSVVRSGCAAEEYGCPYCRCDPFLEARGERFSLLKEWLQSASTASPSVPRRSSSAEGSGPSAMHLARKRLYRSLRDHESSLLMWMAALGLSDGAQTLRGCVLLPRTAAPRGALPLSASLPSRSQPRTTVKQPPASASATIAPAAMTLPPITKTMVSAHAKESAEASPSSSVQPAARHDSTLSLTNMAPLGFFLLPALESMEKLSDAQTTTLLALPSFVAGARQTHHVPPSADSDVWLYQRRAPWSASRRRRTPECHPVHIGPVVACDVFLVGRRADSTTIESRGSASARVSYSVWGCHVYTSRNTAPSSSSSPEPTSSGGANPGKNELFFIADSLEAYVRLGLLFGWIYGWHLCYSSAGPPSSSVPWLSLFNPSAFAAAETLRIQALLATQQGLE